MFGTKSGLLSAFLVVFVFVLAAPPVHAANPFRGSAFQMDPSDWALLDAAARKLYLEDRVEVGAAETWENPETGNSGTVTLIGEHEHEGMPCRRLQHDIALARVRDPYQFMVDRCRTADGEWKILAQ